MNQIIRALKRQSAGEKLAPEQLKALIRSGYVYRNGDLYRGCKVDHRLSYASRFKRQRKNTHPEKPSVDDRNVEP